MLRRWRNFLVGAPAQRVLFRPGIVLDPDVTERLYSRNGDQPVRGVGGTAGLQKSQSISADDGRKRDTVIFALRQAIIFHARSVAFKPVRMAVRKQPAWSNDRQTVERVAQHRPDTF